MYSEPAQKVMPDRAQSRVDDAMLMLRESLESLGDTVTSLEQRLAPVTNEHPRSKGESEMKDPVTDPTGDSHLLQNLYSLNTSLKVQTLRIRDAYNSIDI